MSGARVLVVDAEPEVRRALRTSLGGRGYDVQLAANAGKLITHRILLREVWGAEYEDARPYLHVHVGQLRRKIEPNPAQPIYLLTEPGVGYRFASQDVPAPKVLGKL